MFVMHNKLHMEFVDRIAETARLEAALSGEKSTLVVMYGRRRLGKSTLIKRVLSEGDVYFLADRSEGQHQRLLHIRIGSLCSVRSITGQTGVSPCVWMSFRILWSNLQNCRPYCRNWLMKSNSSIILCFAGHHRI